MILNIVTLLFIIRHGDRIDHLEARMKTTSLRIRNICAKLYGWDEPYPTSSSAASTLDALNDLRKASEAWAKKKKENNEELVLEPFESEV